MSTTQTTKRLQELGVQLPEVAAPVAAYVPAIQVGNQVWTSGQLPFVDGALEVTGLVGDTVTTEQATQLAQTAALNALAAIDELVGIDNVSRVLKVTGFVASADGYTDQPAVINGASNLLGEIFGAQGAHVRSAVGVAQLPLASPVELEIVVEIATETGK
ncbi:RidA family protein [Corynebacterium choanae]|uniref:Endoribonuclease L-PSP n=1 Tax=Corynebacterium choanae TaxID=1862358 RepID=A0A3G6J9V6_9CORY|nr:RidA family protein [Corynebacterium choanae]AZA14572.1 Endoribonuclease L-PSP [Corynebacterium choanae]